jgi:hypothetical protein
MSAVFPGGAAGKTLGTMFGAMGLVGAYDEAKEGHYALAAFDGITSIFALAHTGKAVATEDLGWSPRGGNSKPPPECIGGVCNTLDRCFVAGTLVATREGKKPIETIEVGDEVLSRDANTGQLVYQPVLQLRVTPDRYLVQVDTEREDGAKDRFKTTPNHPFWVEGKGWTEAAQLVPGDKLFSAHGGWLRVTANTWLQETATVYNFEVAETHSYFVGDTETWVHNAGGGLCPGIGPGDGSLKLPEADLSNTEKISLGDGEIEYWVDKDTGWTVQSSGEIEGPHIGRTKASSLPDNLPGEKVGSGIKGDHKGHMIPEGGVRDPAMVNRTENLNWEAKDSNLGLKKQFDNLASRVAAEHPDGTVRTVHRPLRAPGLGRPFATEHYIMLNDELIYGVSIPNR